MSINIQRSKFVCIFIGAKQMGNQICCDDSREITHLNEVEPIVITKEMHLLPAEVQQNSEPQPQLPAEEQVPKVETLPIEAPKEVVEIPKLSNKVEQTLHKYEFFKKESEGTHHHESKRFGGDVYSGEVDQNHKPNGFGKMYKSDGSLYVGHFQHGKAHGKGAYIFPDGSFYNGDFVHNFAESDNSHYQSANLTYTGGFKTNNFSGKGREKGNTHEFEGEYKDGHKLKGTLIWKSNNEQHTYTGTFNSHNKFHGVGILEEPKGTYDGFFVNGLKDGEGFYKGINGIKYKGQYKNDLRNGKGIIYNNDDTIAYEGEIENGLPHGNGWVYKGDVKVVTVWKEGIDTALIEETK